MITYLHIQEAPITDNITNDGHIGARRPWPVVDGEDGSIVVPSSMLGMLRVVGFQKDLAVRQIDIWWEDAFADPSSVIGKYLVATYGEDKMGVSLSAVDSAVLQEHTEPLPTK